MADEKTTNAAQADNSDDKKAKAAAKKKKKEKLEDKPFNEFMTEHFVPNLKETLENQDISDLELSFEEAPIPIQGYGDEQFWQVIGRWGDGGQFRLIFQKEDITGPKFYTAANPGSSPTLLESFMIDERRVNLDLMVFYVVQRLNGQKWLGGN
ncbi:MAG: DUF2996 domain-containing protein [Cyanobacteria bacterium P01_A01_bin.135]